VSNFPYSGRFIDRGYHVFEGIPSLVLGGRAWVLTVVVT